MMSWTADLPTAPGFYWMWLPSQTARVVEIVWGTDWGPFLQGQRDAKALYINGFSLLALAPPKAGTARWIGPLPVPEPPKEA